MLSQAAARPPGAAPPPGLLGGGGAGGDASLLGFGRSSSSGGLGQPPQTQLQLQQELLGGGPSTGPSPGGSLVNTPRTLSGLASGVPQPGDPGMMPGGGQGNVGAPGGGGGGKGWSSLDGIPRPNWQQQLGGGGGHPSDLLGAAVQRPPSTGPSHTLGSMGSMNYEGGMSRGGPSPNPLQGLQGGLPPHLQQHLTAQQRGQQGMPPSGYGQQQQQQQTSLANLQAAAQAAQAAQAAAIRQQALLRNALQGQQQQPNLGNLSQNAALLQHALQQQQQQQAGLQLQQQQNAALLQQQQQLINQANALSRAAQGLSVSQQNQLLQGQLNSLALQQQLNLNQAAAAAASNMRQGGGGGMGGAGGINPALAAALLGGGNNAAAAQQLQALQQAQQNQAAAHQQAQQQLLLSQALRANGMQGGGMGQRPPAQLQSEALIAMQRQQAALQAQGEHAARHAAAVYCFPFKAFSVLLAAAACLNAWLHVLSSLPPTSGQLAHQMPP